jgi:hypothetical protein
VIRHLILIRVWKAAPDVGRVVDYNAVGCARLIRLEILSPTLATTSQPYADSGKNGALIWRVQIPTKSPADSEMMSPGDTR